MSLKFGTSGIRGLNIDFTKAEVESYLTAFVGYARTKFEVTEIAIGGDLRESTPGIKFLTIEALKKLSCSIIDCGDLPTPALANFCIGKNIPGIMITGSHIPADRNGIKFYWPWGEILKNDEIEITKRYSELSKDTKQELPSPAAINLFVQRYIQFFSPLKRLFSGKSVVIYQHSAVTRDVWKSILKPLGFEVIEIGRTSIFNPVDTETDEALKPLRELTKDLKASSRPFAYISSDGDGDRPFLCDENLQMVRGDTIGLLSSQFLKADVVITPISTNTAVEKSNSFSKVIWTKIGSPFVIEAMNTAIAENKNATVVGFEANGGLLLGSSICKNNYELKQLPTRDSVLPVLSCIALALEKNLSLSELVKTLPRRFTSSDVLRGFPIEKKEIVFQKFLETTDFTQVCGPVIQKNDLDGLRLTYKNGDIVHFRPSGNAPEFRCYAESDTSEKAQQLVQKGIPWLSGLKI